jgi:putative SOS response-associated peptidase YedK
MCGRYGFSVESEEEFLKRFELAAAEFDLRDSWNVAPTHEMPIVERHSPNSLHLRKWGIKPPWSPMLLINSKEEKLVESRFWNKPFTTSRCIVPASYFIEWKKTSEGKQPYIIRRKDREMFGFAGLIVTAKDDQGNEVTGYTIITQAAGDFMENIHHRQPAILNIQFEDEWLNPDEVEPERLLKILKAFQYEKDMEMLPISTLVNKVSNNFPEITKPVSSQ